MENELKVVVSNDANEIRSLVSEGYCPVECSIGGESIVDELSMDHHGELSHLESVALRAYRDHFAQRKEDPRFVVTGTCDADAAFAIASLAGLLPHPNKDVSKAPAFLHRSMTKDLISLAETVATIDTDPIGRVVSQMPFGDALLTWGAMNGGATNNLAAVAAVYGWVKLTSGNPALSAFLKAAEESESALREAAQLDLKERGSYSLISRGEAVNEATPPVGFNTRKQRRFALIIDGSRCFGFNTWYQRIEKAEPSSKEGWETPVVLALSEKGQNITIGCPNKDVAEELFGPGGLKNVFPKMPHEGWGGREAVGGSPRGQVMTAQDLQAAAIVVVQNLIANNE